MKLFKGLQRKSVCNFYITISNKTRYANKAVDGFFFYPFDSYQIDGDLTNYKALKLDKFEVDNLVVVEKSLQEYRKVQNKVIEMSTSGNSKEAYEYFNSNINALEVLQKTLTDLSDYNVKEADNVKIQNEKIITTLFRY